MVIKIFTIVLLMVVGYGKAKGLNEASIITKEMWTIVLKTVDPVCMWFRHGNKGDALIAEPYHDKNPYDKEFYNIPIRNLPKHKWIQICFQSGSKESNYTFGIFVQGLNPWHLFSEKTPSNCVLLTAHGNVYLKREIPRDDRSILVTFLIILVAITLILMFCIWWLYKRSQRSSCRREGLGSEMEQRCEGSERAC